MARLTQENFESKCKAIHGDKYDYSSDKYVNMYKTYKVVCKKHGVFEIRPVDHVHAKQGCLLCSSEERRNTNLLKHKKFIENKFDGKYKIVSSEGFETARDVVTLSCSEHGEYKSKISSVRTSPNGNCKECYRSIKADEFLEKAYELHGSKYTYLKKDYHCSRTLMQMYCNLHQSYFTQRPSAHLQGQGCPDCGDIERKVKMSKTQDEFITEATKVHKGAYDYSKVVYTTAHEFIDVVCRVEGHPTFRITANNHLQGGIGCPLCSKEAIRLNHELSFLEKAYLQYGDRVDYSGITYVNNSTPVELRCRDHDTLFTIQPNHHVGNGYGRVGCPDCSALSTGRWNIQSIREIPYIENRRGFLYYGKVSGVKGVKLGVTECLSSRRSGYNTNLRKYTDTNFSYCKSFKSDYLTVFTVEYVLKKFWTQCKVKHNLDFGGKHEMFDLPENHLNFLDDLMEGRYDNVLHQLPLQYKSTHDDFTEVLGLLGTLTTNSKDNK